MVGLTPATATLNQYCPDQPVLRILGRPRLHNPAGTIDPTRQSRALAVLAYFVLHENQATTRELAEAFGRDAPWSHAGIHSTLSRTRTWLGAQPDGSPRLCEATGHHPLRVRGEYHLVNVTSDWAIFQQLITPRPQQVSSHRLLEALSLVTGSPFEATTSRHYGMWADDAASDITLTLGLVRALLHRRLTHASRELKGSLTVIDDAGR